VGYQKTEKARANWIRFSRFQVTSLFYVHLAEMRRSEMRAARTAQWRTLYKATVRKANRQRCEDSKFDARRLIRAFTLWCRRKASIAPLYVPLLSFRANLEFDFDLQRFAGCCQPGSIAVLNRGMHAREEGASRVSEALVKRFSPSVTALVSPLPRMRLTGVGLPDRIYRGPTGELRVRAVSPRIGEEISTDMSEQVVRETQSDWTNGPWPMAEIELRPLSLFVRGQTPPKFGGGAEDKPGGAKEESRPSTIAELTSVVSGEYRDEVSLQITTDWQFPWNWWERPTPPVPTDALDHRVVDFAPQRIIQRLPLERYVPVGRIDRRASGIDGRTIVKLIPKTRFVPYIYRCIPLACIGVREYKMGKFRKAPEPFFLSPRYGDYLDEVLVSSILLRPFDATAGAILVAQGGVRHRSARSTTPSRKSARSVQLQDDWRTPQAVRHGAGTTRRAGSPSLRSPK
jgi:hypothetical protein